MLARLISGRFGRHRPTFLDSVLPTGTGYPTYNKRICMVNLPAMGLQRSSDPLPVERRGKRIPKSAICSRRIEAWGRCRARRIDGGLVNGSRQLSLILGQAGIRACYASLANFSSLPSQLPLAPLRGRGGWGVRGNTDIPIRTDVANHRFRRRVVDTEPVNTSMQACSARTGPAPRGRSCAVGLTWTRSPTVAAGTPAGEAWRPGGIENQHYARGPEASRPWRGSRLCTALDADGTRLSLALAAGAPAANAQCCAAASLTRLGAEESEPATDARSSARGEMFVSIRQCW